MCVTRDMVIANGRTLGDALGCCTFFADNGEGCSNVDLAVVSSSIHPSLGLLSVLSFGRNRIKKEKRGTERKDRTRTFRAKRGGV